jgi:hypothetical protein
MGAGGDFARHNRKTRGDQRFAGHAAFGILPHHFIQHSIGNLVGDLVG